MQSYLHHLLVERKLSSSTCHQRAAGLTFFYHHVLGWKTVDLKIRRRRSGRLPEVLSCQEVRRLICAAANYRDRAVLLVTYGTGVRVSELVDLKLTDIHSDRMLVRVEQGKGRKDRYTLLSAHLLVELRAYWRAYRPQRWLFAKPDGTRPIHTTTAQRIYYEAKRRAGLQRGRGIHTLRHCFATHLLESGVDVRTIQVFLGHKCLNTTMRYLRVTRPNPSDAHGPFDLVGQLRLIGD